MELHGHSWVPGHQLLDDIPQIQNLSISLEGLATTPPRLSPISLSPPDLADRALVSLRDSQLRPNMERRPSADLFELIETRRLTEWQAKKIFRQLGESLSVDGRCGA
jgi:hypothetical protein